MSTTSAEIVADLDEAAEAIIGASYVDQRDTMKAKLWAVLGAAIEKYTPGTASVTPSDTVTSETTFGISAAAGSSANYSRADHTHGTPAAPTAASVGADPAGTAAGLVATEAAARAAADADLAADLAALAPVAFSGSASDLGAGTLPAARLPALSGDLSSSAGSASVVVARVNGVTISGTPSAGQVLVATGGAAAAWASLALACAVSAPNVYNWPTSTGDATPADVVAVNVSIA